MKFTFDMLREAPDATAKLRINPRKDWYANVEAVEAADPHTVVFRLKRPQPVAADHARLRATRRSTRPTCRPATYRTGCVGTGPFKVKEWRKGEFVEYVKNPDYFVKGRPYLDGLTYVVIVERGTRTAALQAGQLDVAFPGETSKTAAEQLKKAVPQLVITPVAQDVSDNIIMNTKKPPFDNPEGAAGRELRHRPPRPHPGGAPGRRGARRVDAAEAVRRLGAASRRICATLPGYGKPDDMKARARKLLAEAGHHRRRSRSRWRWSRAPSRSTWTWPPSSSTS